MASLGKHMKLGRNFGVFKRLKVDERAFDVGGVVVLCLQQEGGWNLGRGLERRIYLAV